ncbi:MAG: hypothetical protein AAFZ09_01485 [Pseudomonadota bacterium]
MMKTMILPVLAAGILSFAAPAIAECSYPKPQTTEKPADESKPQTS